MAFADNIVQFYPNRITVSRRIHRKRDTLSGAPLQKKVKAPQFETLYEGHRDIFGEISYIPYRVPLVDAPRYVGNLLREKTSVNLSANSKRTIRDSIFAMYQLSKPRTVKAVNGKFIYNFRQSFVTLTLPSEQVHSDVELKKCLNHFLTNIRRAFKVENYVWKAELQKNENIHFHLSFDKYIHFQAIRYYWLLAIKPLGYVDAYSAKFSAMSISDYASYRGLSVLDCKDAFLQGVRSRWQSPNCVDVSAVTTASSVSNYLSKYFAKSDATNIDAERVRAFGKVWARSQSLSRLQWKNKFTFEEIRNFIAQLVKMGAVKRVNYDFSTVYYFNFKKLVGFHKHWFEKLLFCNGKRYNYPFPVP